MARAPHLVHVFPSFAVGGTEVRMTSILNGLGSCFSHTIVALDGRFEAASRLSRELDVRLERGPLRRGAVSYPVGLRRFLLQQRGDVVLTYNWGAIDATIGAWLGRIRGVIHNEAGLLRDEALRRYRRRCVIRRIVLNRIFCTVVVSQTLLRIARNEFGVREDKVRLIRTGVDVERFAPASKVEARRTLGLPEEALIFGFVGRLESEKNLGMLLRAFAVARRDDWRLLLVGDGGYRTGLEDEVASLGLREVVEFAGWVEDARSYYAASDIFVLSSVTEQTPNVLLEAMASGLPAVCTDVGDVADLLGDAADCQIAPPNDEERFASLMERLAGDRDLRDRVGVANRSRCLGLFRRERMVAEYKELFLAASSAASAQ